MGVEPEYRSQPGTPPAVTQHDKLTPRGQFLMSLDNSLYSVRLKAPCERRLRTLNP